MLTQIFNTAGEALHQMSRAAIRFQAKVYLWHGRDSSGDYYQISLQRMVPPCLPSVLLCTGKTVSEAKSYLLHNNLI